MSTLKITQPAQTTHSGLRSSIAKHPLTAYFVLAYGLMWTFAIPLGFSRNAGSGVLPYDLPAGIDNVLYLLATFIGPTIAAMIVTGVTEGRAGLGRLFKRMVQWRVQPRWYIVALGINMLLWLLGYTALMGTELLTAAISHWPLLFTTFLPLVAFGMIFPSIAEEPGWRGFALPRLQQRFGPVAASLILGLLHGLWHIPALMTLNFGPLPLANYVPFMLTAMMATVLYTWVYNHTNGSILIAMLMHAASNATSAWLTVLTEDASMQFPQTGVAGWLASTNWITTLTYAIAALLLIVFTRGRLGASRSL